MFKKGDTFTLYNLIVPCAVNEPANVVVFTLFLNAPIQSGVTASASITSDGNTFGHTTGDQSLKIAANANSTNVRILDGVGLTISFTMTASVGTYTQGVMFINGLKVTFN